MWPDQEPTGSTDTDCLIEHAHANRRGHETMKQASRPDRLGVTGWATETRPAPHIQEGGSHGVNWPGCPPVYVLPTDAEALQRDLLLDELASHETSRRRIEKDLDARAATHPGVYLLRTIPGVGARTAEAVMAYIDNPDRFARSKLLGAFLRPRGMNGADSNSVVWRVEER